MNILTRVPFHEILLTVLAIALIIWLLYHAFNDGKKTVNKSTKSSSTTKSSATKPANSGISINIGNTGTQDNTNVDGNSTR